MGRWKSMDDLNCSWLIMCANSLASQQPVPLYEKSSQILRLIHRDLGGRERAQQFQLSAVSTVISMWRAAHNRFIKVAVRSSLIDCHSLAAIEMFVWRKDETVKKRERNKTRRTAAYTYTRIMPLTRVCFTFQSLLLRGQAEASRSRSSRASVRWRKNICRTIELLIAG